MTFSNLFHCDFTCNHIILTVLILLVLQVDAVIWVGHSHNGHILTNTIFKYIGK